MPEVHIQAGAKLFVPNGDEIRGYLKQALIEDERDRERARAVKPMRAPDVFATVASSAVQGGAFACC